MKWFVVAALVLIRLVIIPWAWHVDLYSNAMWGEWIWDHGPREFYRTEGWIYAYPTQPPLINSVNAASKQVHVKILGWTAWIDHQLKKVGVTALSGFVEWFGFGRVNIYVPSQIGYLASMKLLAVVADVGIAIYLAILGKNLKWAIAYLAIPFSWYISSLWGQYDQLAMLLAGMGLILLAKRQWLIAPTVFGLGVMIKPTVVVLGLLFGLLQLRHIGFGKTLLGWLLAFIVILVTSVGYSYRPIWDFWRYDLRDKILLKSEYRFANGSLNFWRIAIGGKHKNQNELFLGIPGKYWGNGAWIALSLLAAWHVRTLDVKRVWEAAFVVSAGGWMFMMNMAERYFFAGVASGLAVIIFRPKLQKWWVLLAMVFCINLYFSWGWPWMNDMVKQLISDSGRLIAAIGLYSYVKMVKAIIGNDNS
jgi:Gpi18-like mannosyltransferase